MPTHLRTLLIPLPTFVLGACFDPMVDPEPADGTASSTASDEAETRSATDTDATGPDEGVDDTGPFDAPPVLTAFTVQSSTMPAEVQVAGLIAFDVDATDDIGIDRVEVYDGDTLVTTTTEIPYVTKLLVTSADNGTHLYSAIAYDTSGQTAHSDPVPLSINVVGGEILEIREDVADAYMPVGLGYPRVVSDETGDVHVTLTTLPDALDRSHVRALGYSSTLSLLWESSLDPVGSSVIAAAHPITTSTGELLVGAVFDVSPVGNDTMGLNRANVSTGEPLEPLLLAGTNGDFVFPVTAELPSGNIVLAPEPNVLEARGPDLASVSWTEEQFPALPDDTVGQLGMLGLDVDGAGNLLLTFVAPESTCGENEVACIRKLSPDGTTLWTRPASSMGSLSFMPARFDRNGRAITAWAAGSEGALVNVYGGDGTLESSFQALRGPEIFAQDLAVDAQGNVLLVGYQDDGLFEAWAARLSPTGEVLWSRTYDVLEPGELGAAVTGIAVTTDGRAYVVGVSEMTIPGPFAYAGKVWAASIKL